MATEAPIGDSDGKTVAAVERALDVLEAFKRGEKILSLAQICEYTGLYKSTILRLAHTLEVRGYLIRLPDGNFQIGPEPLLLGALYQATLQPETVILPILQELTAVTGESASYHIRQGEVRVCVYRVNSQHIVRDHLFPGDVRPLGVGAAGRVLQAFARPYRSDFEGVRRKLLVHSNGEIELEMTGLGAPVFAADGSVSAAVTVSGPSGRFTRQAIRKMEQALLNSVERITRGLGGDISPYVRKDT